MQIYGSPRTSNFLSAYISQDGQYIGHDYTDDRACIYVYKRFPCHTSCRSCIDGNANKCTACACGFVPQVASPVMSQANPGTCVAMAEKCDSCALDSSNNFGASGNEKASCAYGGVNIRKLVAGQAGRVGVADDAGV